MCPLEKDSEVLTQVPVNMTLFGNRIFAVELLKLREDFKDYGEP